MVRFKRMAWIGILFYLASNVSAFAYPEFFELYKKDPYLKVQPRDCSACHMSPQGGDNRNPFGQAFDAQGQTITPLLRAQFPERFAFPITKVSDTLTIYFSDPNNKVVVLDSGGRKTVVDVDKKTVDGKAAAVSTVDQSGAIQPVTAGAPTAAAGLTSPPQAPHTEIRSDEYAHEGAIFGDFVGDLSTPKPIQKGGVDFRIGHRFTEAVFQSDSPRDLLGFDSGAVIDFGARVGLTNRVSVYGYRTNEFRTIEMGSAFQVSRQSTRIPLTVQFRGGVEGQNNFSQTYSGYFEGLTEHTFADRVSLLFDPIFAINTRNEAVATVPQFGINHNNTLGLGTGLGFRFLPTASVVAEYIPRVWGYRGVTSDQPTISVGLQKATQRHAFELLISTSEVITTPDYTVNATDKFRIGFNIYRKLR